MTVRVTPPMVSLRDHPRAAVSIRRWKARAALAGFLAIGVGTHVHGGGPLESAEHALIGGVAARMLAWAAAVTVWRQLLAGEARRAVARAIELRSAHEAEKRGHEA